MELKTNTQPSANLLPSRETETRYSENKSRYSENNPLWGGPPKRGKWRLGAILEASQHEAVKLLHVKGMAAHRGGDGVQLHLKLGK